MKKEYDRLDLLILNELTINCKQPYRELAKKLGTHPNTLMQRIKKLEQDEVILNYSSIVDYNKLGYGVHAMILIRIKKGTVGDETQLTSVKKMPEVVALYAITGNYDVAAVIKVKSQEDLSALLKRMQQTSEITRTASYIVLYTYKHHYEFNPLESISTM